MDKLKTTNTLLLIIVIPLIFYILKILSFIFIPLVFSMFLALLFLPLMRWLGKKNIKKPMSLIIVLLIIAVFFRIGGELVHYSSKELMSFDTNFKEKATNKLIHFVVNTENYFGIENVEDSKVIERYLNKNLFSQQIGNTISFLSSTLSMLLLTAFFLVLWLLESINIQKLMHKTFLKQEFSSVKVFMKIENDLIKFIKVKFIISLFTGIGISLACMYFDVSFPIFWGLFAFVINFVQMVGSFISVILLTAFAFLELDPNITLLFFILTITGVQVLMGGILEPVFMGKSFSINIITILIVLSLWGFIWGIPGMIMAIPITVFIKIFLEQFEKTKNIANLISGVHK